MVDYAEASAKVREYIEAHDLGAGCSGTEPHFTGGEIRADDHTTALGRVAYNGRIFDVDGKEIRI